MRQKLASSSLALFINPPLRWPIVEPSEIPPTWDRRSPLCEAIDPLLQAEWDDEVGYIQQNRDEMEVLFTLLADRFERGGVMLTSNLPFSKWDQIFKDPTTTAAAVDRLVHHSVIIELNLESYRLEVSKKPGKQASSVTKEAEKAIRSSKTQQKQQLSPHGRGVTNR